MVFLIVTWSPGAFSFLYFHQNPQFNSTKSRKAICMVLSVKVLYMQTYVNVCLRMTPLYRQLLHTYSQGPVLDHMET